MDSEEPAPSAADEVPAISVEKRTADVKKKLRIRPGVVKIKPKPTPMAVRRHKSNAAMKTLTKAKNLVAKTGAAAKIQKAKANLKQKALDNTKKATKVKRKLADNKNKAKAKGSDTSMNSMYRTRNAESMEYEERLKALRSAKKISRITRKREVMESKYEDKKFQYETMNESRILACGLWFRVGDVISVYGDKEAGYKTYYGQILMFSKDWLGEYYCRIRWLIPVSVKRLNNSYDLEKRKFDFSNYLEGPIHEELLNMRNVNFVSHCPSGPGTVAPGTTTRYNPNSSLNMYKVDGVTKMLDVPSFSASSIDSTSRNPYF